MVETWHVTQQTTTIFIVIIITLMCAVPGPPMNVQVAKIAERSQLIITWDSPTNPNGVIQSKHRSSLDRNFTNLQKM